MNRIIQVLGTDLGSIIFNYMAPLQESSKSSRYYLPQLGPRVFWPDCDSWLTVPAKTIPDDIRRILGMSKSNSKLINIGPFFYNDYNCKIYLQTNLKISISLCIDELYRIYGISYGSLMYQVDIPIYLHSYTCI